MKQLSQEPIEQRIHLIRGFRVMLDSDLAALYGVNTKRLNEQVRRNQRRFPEDFMFRLTVEEAQNLKSQIATSSSAWGGRRKLPRVFTQEGVAMLSGVLHSARAIQVNIAIMRAFVKLREMALLRKELAQRLKDIESKVISHDEKLQEVFEAIHKLMEPPKLSIGFQPR